MREQSISAKNSNDHPDLETFASLYSPSFQGRIAVIGIGNRLWGDDAAGPELLKRLKEEWEVQEPRLNSQGQRFFIDAGESPEDWLIRIVDLKPDVILVIDAIDLQAKPGSIAILESEALPEAFCCSTHRLPLRTLLHLWERNGSKTLVLGIQPKDVIFREGLSAEVKMSIDLLSRFLSRRHSWE
jgi:hydrogenase 3 maturation protease